MAFKWSELKDLYMRACGDSTMAAQEWYNHATAASRWLAAKVREKELISTQATVLIAVGEDSFDWDTDAYSIMSMFNRTNIAEVRPESGGMVGRNRYTQSDGKPSSGIVSWYHPEGKKVWIRQKASAATTLELNFKMVPPDVVQGIQDNHPIFPPHLDYALLYKSVALFYGLHPRLNVQTAGGSYYPVSMSQSFADQAQAVIDEATPPKVEENRNRTESFKQYGYQMW